MNCRTVRQRPLISSFRLVSPVRKLSTVNGAEKLGQCGGGIVYHRIVTDGS